MQPSKGFGERDEDRSYHENHLTQMLDYYRRTGEHYNDVHGNEDRADYGHNVAVKEILAALRATNSKTLLDVCCGTGRATKAALDNGFDVMGVDVSPELLKVAHTEAGIPMERLRQADATQLPFPDNSFDVACVLGALHHTAMPRQIVAEVIRVARRAVVISDGGNTLYGGVKRILIKVGVFEPLYRLVFRRPPREGRRMILSEGDGPAFAFSIEEVIPQLTSRFERFKSINSYNVGKSEVWSPRFPRMFARGVVATAWNKRSEKL